jgi:hypothetical protein
MEYIGIYGKIIIRLIFKFYRLFICGVDFSGSVLGVICRYPGHCEEFRIP